MISSAPTGLISSFGVAKQESFEKESKGEWRMPNKNCKIENGTVYVYIDNAWIQPSFKRYENIQPVGEAGANGVVVKATHKTTGRLDAIKIWLPRKRNGITEVNKQQYKAEIQKIAELKDPRIPVIYDAWTENNCYCCSMEYIDGVTYEKWRYSFQEYPCRSSGKNPHY